jgi:hypothetical protein
MKPLRVGKPQPSSAENLAWAKEALRLEVAALPAVRASAERWTASLGAVLGGVGLGALLRGPGDFDQLAGTPSALGKVCFIAAVVAGCAATASAAVAAQVTRVRVLLPGGATFRVAAQRATSRAFRLLRASQILAGAAVVLLLLAVGILWWGNHEMHGHTSGSAAAHASGLKH